MELIVMECAKGNGELVADFEREPALLGKRQMMGLRRLPAANQTRMGGDEHEMGLVPEAAFRADLKQALVDPWALGDFRRAEWRRGRVGRLRGAGRLNQRRAVMAICGRRRR